MRDALRAAAHDWLDDDPVRAIVRDFALSIQAVRLIECGFEDHLNAYRPAELLILATMLPDHQFRVIVADALARADNRLLWLMEQRGCLPVEAV